jgi:hypothetical protein
MKLYFACDETYFYHHGYEFCRSATEHGNSVLGHIFVSLQGDPYEKQQMYNMSYARMATLKNADIKIELMDTKLYTDVLKTADIRDYRALYASMRFLNMPKLIDDMPLLISDVDSIILDKIEIEPEYDLGLFLRENNSMGGNDYEQQGMKIAAGAVYVTPRARQFIQVVHDTLISNPFQWFNDQHALYKAYQLVKDKYKIKHFDDNFMNWDFNKKAPIWTGKGNRKYDDQTYLDMKKKYALLEDSGTTQG